MISKEVLIKNESGLHAYPASQLVELCKRYRSNITICTDEMELDGKSIISILLGCIYKGTSIKILVDGEDEEEALQAIIELINNLEG